MRRDFIGEGKSKGYWDCWCGDCRGTRGIKVGRRLKLEEVEWELSLMVDMYEDVMMKYIFFYVNEKKFNFKMFIS